MIKALQRSIILPATHRVEGYNSFVPTICAYENVDFREFNNHGY